MNGAEPVIPRAGKQGASTIFKDTSPIPTSLERARELSSAFALTLAPDQPPLSPKLWAPAGLVSPAGEPVPSFERFAGQWLAGRRGELSPRGVEYYEWALGHHLMPYFGSWRLDRIDIRAVDEYRRYKVRQSEERRSSVVQAKRSRTDQMPRPLGPATINKTIDVLAAVLSLATEYGHIERNPAAGRRRRLRRSPQRAAYLDTAEQIEAVLDAAAELDASSLARTSGRRALIATLILAGPRAGEACALRWRDLDLANGRIHICQSKTQAGVREITLLPRLRDELATHKASQAETQPDSPVFLNARGGPRDRNNLRRRVLDPAIARADELLLAADRLPLPPGVTPHKLRHTYASILVACGEDPASVMAQLGHSDPQFTLRIYTHLMRRDSAERDRLKRFVYGTALPAVPDRSAPASGLFDR